MSRQVHCDVEGCTKTAPLENVKMFGRGHVRDIPVGWSEVTTIENRVPKWAKEMAQARIRPKMRGLVNPLNEGFPTAVRRHICAEHSTGLTFKKDSGEDDLDDTLHGAMIEEMQAPSEQAPADLGEPA